jgi:uncharacterized protein YdhG (YjbR/CyaY superfamily)
MSDVPKTVDEYFAAVLEEPRAALEGLRLIIKAAAPGATEKISYQIPSFYDGRPLVALGAAKNHCAFYVMSTAVMEAHQDELWPYDTSKGTIRFKSEQPVDDPLVQKLVKTRIEENEAIQKAKREGPRGRSRSA